MTVLIFDASDESATNAKISENVILMDVRVPVECSLFGCTVESAGHRMYNVNMQR